MPSQGNWYHSGGTISVLRAAKHSGIVLTPILNMQTLRVLFFLNGSAHTKLQARRYISTQKAPEDIQTNLDPCSISKGVTDTLLPEGQGFTLVTFWHESHAT